MKWKTRLTELGLDENNVSQGLKSKIRDYYDIQSGINELKKSIANPSVNDDVNELEEQLTESVEVLEALDNKLVKDVEYYNKHKDKYADMTKKLAEGRARKKQANGGATPPKKVEATPTPNEPTPPTPKDPIATDGDKDKEKKGSGFGWVIFAVAVGVVTLGAVNLMKND